MYKLTCSLRDILGPILNALYEMGKSVPHSCKIKDVNSVCFSDVQV